MKKLFGTSYMFPLLPECTMHFMYIFSQKFTRQQSLKLCHLTHYQIISNLQRLEAIYKHCGIHVKMVVTSSFSFFHNVFLQFQREFSFFD